MSNVTVTKTAERVEQGIKSVWYKITGHDKGTGHDLDGEYGVYEDGSIVDCDNMPMVEGDMETIAVNNALGL